MSVFINGVRVPVAGDSSLLLLPLLYSAIVQGAWIYLTGASHLGGNMYNSSAADADEVNYVAYMAAGTYTLIVVHPKDTDRGIAEVKIDGVLADSTDQYAAAPELNIVTKTTGIVVATSGLKTITWKANSKNGSSSAYSIFFSVINFWRTS